MLQILRIDRFMRKDVGFVSFCLPFVEFPNANNVYCP